jgi:hypothetical protein
LWSLYNLSPKSKYESSVKWFVDWLYYYFINIVFFKFSSNGCNCLMKRWFYLHFSKQTVTEEIARDCETVTCRICVNYNV